jgi:hypothetical protein
MSIEDSLGTALLAQAAITATVGAIPLNTGGSVPSIAPMQSVEDFKNSFPRIVFLKTADAPVYSDAGPAALRRAEFEIECQGHTIADAETVRSAVNAYLNPSGGFRGALGSNTVNRLFVTDEHDTPHPAIHGEEIGVRAKTMAIEVDYV